MIFQIKRGDLDPAFPFALQIDGEGVNLTGRSVLFLMTNTRTNVLKVNAVPTILNVEHGQCEYAWVSGDTDTAGMYRAEVQVTTAGKPRTFPPGGYFYIEIGENLGP